MAQQPSPQQHAQQLTGYSNEAARKYKVPGRLKSRDVLDMLNFMDWCCFYCGEPASFVRHSSKRISLDHVMPLSKGGQNAIENILPSCCACNGKKGDRELEKFLNKYGHNPTEFEQRHRVLWTLMKQRIKK